MDNYCRHKQLNKSGWTCAASPAVPTATDGRLGHGGVWVMAKNNVASRTPYPCRMDATGNPQHYGTQWTARALRRHGMDIAFISIYLKRQRRHWGRQWTDPLRIGTVYQNKCQRMRCYRGLECDATTIMGFRMAVICPGLHRCGSSCSRKCQWTWSPPGLCSGFGGDGRRGRITI
eukprot:7827343-Pyramimonas_sp.AAC.1